MIVHGCTGIKNYTNYTTQAKPKKDSISQTRTASIADKTSFSALKMPIIYKGRFDPTKSASAYELYKSFLSAYATNSLFKNYEVKATFFTDWLKEHPNYPFKKSKDYFASICTMLLEAKKLPQDNSMQSKLKFKMEQPKYYYIGMYGDDSLTGAEENLAYFLQKFTYMDILCNLEDKPRLAMLEPLEKRFFEE